MDSGYVMIDGGIWANNPIMNTLVDALAYYDVPESDTLIALDDVTRSLSELPLVARSLAEASGHMVFERFLSEAAGAFERCEQSL